MSKYNKMSYATYQKHWHLDSDSKRAPIPHLIWTDGHAEWSRWYWFKEDNDRIGRGQFSIFLR